VNASFQLRAPRPARPSVDRLLNAIHREEGETCFWQRVVYPKIVMNGRVKLFSSNCPLSGEISQTRSRREVLFVTGKRQLGKLFIQAGHWPRAPSSPRGSGGKSAACDPVMGCREGIEGDERLYFGCGRLGADRVRSAPWVATKSRLQRLMPARC
jgi:hypothetical protein